MNELVKALIEKAREEVKSRQKFGSDPLHRDLFSADDFHQRIAELIVEECARVCLEQRDPSNLNYKPSERFAEAVKQHFGVF